MADQIQNKKKPSKKKEAKKPSTFSKIMKFVNQDKVIGRTPDRKTALDEEMKKRGI